MSCQNCCIQKIPKGVKKLLNDDQNVIFKGSYDINSIVIKGNIVTNNMNVCENKNGYNIYTDIFYYTKTSSDAPIFSLETFTLSSYNCDLSQQKGVITFTNLYSNSGSGGVSTASIIPFNVIGADGIYKDITRVIIDTENSIRQVYFCK